GTFRNLLIFVKDNCPSHMTYNSVLIYAANGTNLFRLPPNSTHLLKPLDVALFRTFKPNIANRVNR
ncbi:hypothetical protein DYB32_010374, partial [Aphanomyces invadans]